MIFATRAAVHVPDRVVLHASHLRVHLHRLLRGATRAFRIRAVVVTIRIMLILIVSILLWRLFTRHMTVNLVALALLITNVCSSLVRGEETLRRLVLAGETDTRPRLVYLTILRHATKATCRPVGPSVCAVHRRPLNIQRLCAPLLVRVGGLGRR